MKTPSILGENLVRTVFFVKKWEISMMLGVLAMILCCAASPHLTTQWWTTAFSPLCDAILAADAGGGGIVLRSKLYDLLMQYVG